MWVFLVAAGVVASNPANPHGAGRNVWVARSNAVTMSVTAPYLFFPHSSVTASPSPGTNR